MSSKPRRMFSFITKQWSPVIGCEHNCSYCWARKLAERRLSKMLSDYETGFKPKFLPMRLLRCKNFTEKDFIFVCDMADLFGEWIPREWQEMIFYEIGKSPAKFLLLTKNPKNYIRLLKIIPENCTLGATIETNRDEVALMFSFAPAPSLRWKAMEAVALSGWPNLLICIEPIMDFDLEEVVSKISALSLLSKQLKSLTVAVGLDNYKNYLIEPPLEKTMELIERLEKIEKVKVVRKTLREPLSSTEQKTEQDKFREVSKEATRRWTIKTAEDAEKFVKETTLK